MKRFLFFVAFVISACSSLEAAHPAAPRGLSGAVSCAASDARDAGLEVLRMGGNAADAAVATALALAVVHPQAGNIGGGGFAVIRFDGEVKALDFRETAPSAATRDMFLDKDGTLKKEASLVGPLAAGVPGSPAGLFELQRAHGKLEWAQVVAPALRLAAEGFVVPERLHRTIARYSDQLARFPETAAIWLPNGDIPQTGSTLQQPDLARTLKAYSENGLEGLSDVAQAIEATSKRYGGIMTAEDFLGYEPVWRDAVQFKAFGWDVASMPLPSSGGIILGQACGLLERVDWTIFPRFGAHRFHLLAESLRRAFADRFMLGDPESTLADVSQLFDASWLDERAGQIRLTQATESARVDPWSPGVESQDTTHLSVIDSDGNAVSLTTTLNGNFGCLVTVAGAGFLLNNEMDDFAALPGEPNQFGLVQGEANAVRPGLRMLSSMSPTIAWKGEELLVLGAPGGSRIPTATLQVLLNVIVDGDHLQAAVDRARVHHQWLPDTIYAEANALSPDTENILIERGHKITPARVLGEVSAVFLGADGVFEAAQDPRGPGASGVVAPSDRR